MIKCSKHGTATHSSCKECTQVSNAGEIERGEVSICNVCKEKKPNSRIDKCEACRKNVCYECTVFDKRLMIPIDGYDAQCIGCIKRARSAIDKAAKEGLGFIE